MRSMSDEPPQSPRLGCVVGEVVMACADEAMPSGWVGCCALPAVGVNESNNELVGIGCADGEPLPAGVGLAEPAVSLYILSESPSSQYGLICGKRFTILHTSS